MERTFTRENPKTGENETRVVDNNADAVKLNWDGWKEQGSAPRAAKKAAKKGAPPARELNDES